MGSDCLPGSHQILATTGNGSSAHSWRRRPRNPTQASLAHFAAFPHTAGIHWAAIQESTLSPPALPHAYESDPRNTREIRHHQPPLLLSPHTLSGNLLPVPTRMGLDRLAPASTSTLDSTLVWLAAPPLAYPPPPLPQTRVHCHPVSTQQPHISPRPAQWSNPVTRDTIPLAQFFSLSPRYAGNPTRATPTQVASPSGTTTSKRVSI